MPESGQSEFVWCRLSRIRVFPRPRRRACSLHLVAQRTSRAPARTRTIHGYDGIDLDYETMASPPPPVAARRGPARLRDPRASNCAAVCTDAQVVQRHRDAQAGGRYWSVSTTRAWCAAADRLKLMTYDEHWSRSPAGPIASLPWVTKVVKYALTRVAGREARARCSDLRPRLGGGRSQVPSAACRRPRSGQEVGREGPLGQQGCGVLLHATPTRRGNPTPCTRQTHGRSEERVALARRFGLAGVALWSVSGAPPDGWRAVRSVVGARAYPGAPVRNGSRGPTVAAVQGALGIAADGVFGPQTRSAVRAFQRAHRLAADGIVGPRTWATLFASTPVGQSSPASSAATKPAAAAKAAPVAASSARLGPYPGSPIRYGSRGHGGHHRAASTSDHRRRGFRSEDTGCRQGLPGIARTRHRWHRRAAHLGGTRIAAHMADSTGRRNTSMTEVCGGEFEEAVAGASAGRAAAVGSGQGAAAGDALTGPSGAVAGGAARVLAADRDRDHDSRGVGGRGRVLAGRCSLVSSRWRDVAAESGRAHGQISVVR